MYRAWLEALGAFGRDGVCVGFAEGPAELFEIERMDRLGVDVIGRQRGMAAARQVHPERASGGRHGKLGEVGFEATQRHERVVAQLDFVEQQKGACRVGLDMCERGERARYFEGVVRMLEDLARLLIRRKIHVN